MQGGGAVGGRKRARIEIVPLIDVMFFLLASFMMISLSMQKSQTVKVHLPVADHALADFKSDVISIGITQSGVVYLGSNVVEFVKLDDALKQGWGRSTTNAPVLITADENTRHGDVARVLQHVRNAGFQKVSFVAISKPRSTQPIPDSNSLPK